MARKPEEGDQVALGAGPYADIGQSSPAVYDARNLFFAAIERETPDVLASLRDGALGAYGDLFRHADDVWGEYDYSRDGAMPARWPWDWSAPAEQLYNPALVSKLAAYEVAGPWGWDRLEVWGRLRPGLRPLRDALLDWGARWRLDQGWCLRFAFRQVDAWYRWPLARWRYDEVSVPTILTDDERRFSLTLPGWDLTAERWTEAETRLDAAYEEAKRAHRQRLTALAEALELAREPTKATPEHYAWLARYHLRGESYGRIAEGHHERKSVEEAVKRAAALIGLDLRPPSSAGRPRGVKSASYRQRDRE